MKRLSVPFYLQPAGSTDCGPTCVRMVLDYYGIKQDLLYLKKSLTYSEVGTSAYDNGALLLSEGLKVTAVTAHPDLFPPDLGEGVKTTDDIIAHLRAKAKDTPRHKGGLRIFEKFLLVGGRAKLEIPAEEHIYKAIDAKKPVIALVYGQALGSNEGGYHFVVVTGYDARGVYVNNPYAESKRQARYPLRRFLYALHTSTLSDVDNGTLLVVGN